MRIASNKQDLKDDNSQLRADVQKMLESGELGPSIEKPRLRGLHRLSISDERPADGPLTEAYVDQVKDHLFIKVTGSGFGGPNTVGPTWYGPLPVKPSAKS